jgi:hypothetical protein
LIVVGSEHVNRDLHLSPNILKSPRFSIGAAEVVESTVSDETDAYIFGLEE